jgi:hypothetical protein
MTMTMTTQPDFVTLKELCVIHKLNRATVGYWIQTGKLVTHKIGNRHRVYQEDWNKFIEGCNVK